MKLEFSNKWFIPKNPLAPQKNVDGEDVDVYCSWCASISQYIPNLTRSKCESDQGRLEMIDKASMVAYI